MSATSFPEGNQIRTVPIFGLCAEGLGIDGMRDLRGMRLRNLILAGYGWLNSLTLFSGMELDRLEIRDCPNLRTLEGVETLNLQVLDIENCGIRICPGDRTVAVRFMPD
jgi:hypothetical protein